MSDPIGHIHSIETLGTLDGPGIRTVVFFQGCPLRCKYCHNVDSTLTEGGEEYTVQQLVDKVLKNREYWSPYSHSSQVADAKIAGGVTISGGDPTFQPAFLLAFVKALRAEKVHVAIDTSLACTEELIRDLVPLVNLWMISIKEFDSERHRQLTGVGNKKIQANIRFLDDLITEQKPAHSPQIRHRFVLLPGVTDSEEMLSQLGEHCRTIRNLELLELLPYSSLGKHKWIELYGHYDLESMPDGTDEDVQAAKTFLAPYGLSLLG